MGFTEVLTIIFVLLKVFGVVTWSWWLVFLPEIIALLLYVIFIIASVRIASKADKEMTKFFDEEDK